MFPLLLACWGEPPVATTDEAPTVEMDLTKPEPLATGPGVVPVPVADKEDAVKRACLRLEECGCTDEQPFEKCAESGMLTTLPDTVYRCIASKPCEVLCQPNPQGTHDKGLTACVDPYLEESIGRGEGLNKRVE
ncbi:MAG TPA: hypothetical protein QGF58_03805 [Myxococcota bacterium]|nr:hypothetical protein [Myxococcota bacterium]